MLSFTHRKNSTENVSQFVFDSDSIQIKPLFTTAFSVSKLLVVIEKTIWPLPNTAPEPSGTGITVDQIAAVLFSPLPFHSLPKRSPSWNEFRKCKTAHMNPNCNSNTVFVNRDLPTYTYDQLASEVHRCSTKLIHSLRQVLAAACYLLYSAFLD